MIQWSSAPASFFAEDMNSEHPVVLVVDNSPAIQDMLSWVLTLQGYQPICLTNGKEALDWIERALRTGQYPKVILLDLYMPIMSGSAFLERLRALWKSPLPIPPILLLTVQAGNYDYLECSGVLTKPFHIRDLCDRLRRMTGRA